MTATENLRRAIEERLVVAFTYDGSARVAQPHALGYDLSGDLTLSAWQTSGRSGEGWRSYHVSKVSGLSIGPATFEGPRPDHNPSGLGFSRVLIALPSGSHKA